MPLVLSISLQDSHERTTMQLEPHKRIGPRSSKVSRMSTTEKQEAGKEDDVSDSKPPKALKSRTKGGICGVGRI
jgi:hypothetical protein